MYVVRELSPILGGLYLYFKIAIPCYSSAFPALDQTSEQLVLGVEDRKTVVETPKVDETLNF